MNYKIVNIKTKTNGSPDASVLIIYSGGTLGMEYDQDGSLIPFNFSSLRQQVPQLENYNLKITAISFPEPLDSSDINATHWADLAFIIHENYHQYDGFVIIHGTDTMAYTASALSYMLPGLKKPVILTGSQLPIGAMRSDARENLFTAIEIASSKHEGQSIISEVCIFFSSKLMRGNRAKKIRSSQFSAFESENYPDLAHAGIQITYNHAYFLKNTAQEYIELKSKMDENVIIIKLFPNISKYLFKNILDCDQLKGVILETFGSGNAPTYPWFLDLIRSAIERGVIVLNISQCPGGNVIQGRYKASKHLKEMGVISGHDMTTEAAVTKLMFLLGQYSDKNIIKQKLKSSLAGELS